MFSQAIDALNFFGGIRDATCSGVEVPSQRRYVGYMARIIRREVSFDDLGTLAPSSPTSSPSSSSLPSPPTPSSSYL